MERTGEPRPLASSLTELRAQGVFVLLWGIAGLAALSALEDTSKVLIGAVLGAAFMLALWLPATTRARSRRGGRSVSGAPPGARREEQRETVRRALSGRAWIIPAYVLSILLPSLLYGPIPDDAAIVAGGVMGMLVGGGLESIKRAVRLARWQQAHGLVLLSERPALRLSLRREPRRMFSEPLPRAGRS